MNEALFFYALAFIAVLSALYVVTTPNPTYAVLSLTVTMFSLACLFVLLKAFFVAVIHLLVYAGAILVLFLFVVMLLGPRGPAPEERPAGALRLEGLFIGAAIFLEIVIAIRILAFSKPEGAGAALGTIEAVGRILFTRYLLPFEIASVLLLVAIVGAVTLARREAA